MLTDEMVEALPELPQPCCTYADHSYPAFTAAQMRDYARAALTAAQSAGSASGAVGSAHNNDRSRVNAAMYMILERLDAHPDILAAVGSLGDTLSDGDVAALLEDWLQSGVMLRAPQ